MNKKSIVFFAHPNFSSSRLNKRLIEEVRKFPEISIKDLYQSYGTLAFTSPFDPAPDQKLIEEYDRIILQFPFYWYSTPPLLKYWIDGILTSGWAYSTPSPKTEGKELLVAITTGGKESDYKPNGYNNYYTTDFLTPFIQTAKLCKMSFGGSFFVQGANVITDTQLQEKAEQYINFIMKNKK